MAIPYPQPNWIKPADPASHFARGYGLGLQGGQAQAQINMERARLAEAQNRTALTIALRQQELERQSMVDQQKLEVEKAYRQQQGELKAQELEMKAQALQEKIKEAAARTMAMDRFRSDLAAGKDPLMSMLGLAGNPSAGAPVSAALRGIAERNKPAKNVEPQTKTIRIGNKDVDVVWNPNTGHFSFPPGSKEPVLTRNQAGQMLRDSQTLAPELFGGDEGLKKYQQSLVEIAQGKNAAAAAPKSPFKEGDIIRHKQTKQVVGRIVNGVLVPIGAEPEPQEALNPSAGEQEEEEPSEE